MTDRRVKGLKIDNGARSIVELMVAVRLRTAAPPGAPGLRAVGRVSNVQRQSMNSIEAIRIALQSLWANKLRSVLTLLGVVIGVAAVIAVVTFVEGINTYVAEKIFNLGADVFIIFKVSPALTNVDHYLEAEKRKDLLMEDYQTVRDACRHCVYVGAAVRNNSGHVKYAEQSITDTTVQGITPSMAPIYDTDLTAGRMLNETDLNNKSPVIVVGTDIVEHLMTGSDPLGKEVRLDGWTYQVIGVGKKKGKTMGQSQDNYVMIPITAYLKQYGVHNQNIRISGKAASAGPPLNVAIDEARAALRASRHDRPEADDSFDIETNASLLGVWADFSSTFFIATIGIACISLVVGGIVIMNIMLVTVTERTREIGIRKALGARRGDVLLQFLIEAVTLAVMGGAFGVLLGVTIAETITLLIGMPSAIKLWAVAAGLMVAASVGVFFGVYPARKAAKLDPIVALRFEM
jgi:putative ABC transport system permease protein